MQEKLLTLIEDILFKDYKFIKIESEILEKYNTIRIITSFYYLGTYKRFERYYKIDIDSNLDSISKDYIKYFNIYMGTL